MGVQQYTIKRYINASFIHSFINGRRPGSTDSIVTSLFAGGYGSNVSLHMCGVNQFWIIVFFTAVKPANNILFCIELIQRPESSSRRHKLGLTDQSIHSNDDKTRWPFIFNHKCARCFSDVHTSFPCLFPASLEVTLYCGETRINDQLWDYSVINRIPFISELSTVRYWKLSYWLICPDLFAACTCPKNESLIQILNGI